MDKKDNKLNYQNFLEESFEDLYENAPCGYFSSLPDGTIVKINQTLAQWLGYQKSEILHQKRFRDLLPIGGKIYYETHHAPLIRIQGSINEINYDLVSKEGTLLPVLINSFHITNNEGTIILYRSTVVNIADRKKYEVELIQAKKKAEQAAKTKAEFLSTVSHEIRTPMNAIIGVANLLLATEPTARQLEYLHILKLSSENLLNLINDILDFNKIESGKIILEEKAFNIKDLLHTIIYHFQAKSEEKDILLKDHIDENIPQNLIGDPIKLTQVLTNLIANAIKFTHSGSVSIDLKAREITSDEVVIDFIITDTGIGIAPDKIHKIFEEFTQADYEINVKYGGTGLGLAISKKLLAMYGSVLHVESELNKGSKFSFRLKLKISNEIPIPAYLPIQPMEQEASLRGIKLLLAEDNSVNIFIVSQYLNTWEVDFDIAENGSVAIEKILENDYNLVLMDLQMPEMNGYEASRILRNRPEEKYQKLPIIALSASSKFDLKQRLEHAGINDFISKPFDPKDLYGKISLYGATFINKNAETTLPKKAIQAPISFHTEAHSTLINLSYYRKLTKNEPGRLAELIQLSIDNFISFQEDLKVAFETGNKKLLEEVTHKSKLTIRSLEAIKLLSLIEQANKLMDEDEKDETKIRSISQEISNQITGIINELNNQNPDSPEDQSYKVSL